MDFELVSAASSASHTSTINANCNNVNKEEAILFSSDDSDVEYSDEEDCGNKLLIEDDIIELSKRIYPLIRSLDDRRKDNSKNSEKKCCDFFIMEISTEEDSLSVYTILKKWITEKEIVDPKCKQYVSIKHTEKKSLQLNSTHVRKLMRVFHMVFSYEQKKSKLGRYQGIVKTWGDMLPGIIESMFKYATPEKCMSIFMPLLVKWKERKIVPRSVINVSIDKANRVIQAHIDRREQRQLTKKSNKRHLTDHGATTSNDPDTRNNKKKPRMEPTTVNTKRKTENSINYSDDNNKPGEEKELEDFDEEDISCVTPPPMYSDDIDSDDDEGVSIKKEMKYKKYLDGKILKNVEAELKYRNVNFKTISVHDYIKKRKKLLPTIFSLEEKAALEKEKYYQEFKRMVRSTNTISNGLLHTEDESDDDLVEIDYRKIFQPPLPTPINEVIRAKCIDEMNRCIANVVLYGKQPDGSEMGMSTGSNNDGYINNNYKEINKIETSNNSIQPNSNTGIINDNDITTLLTTLSNYIPNIQTAQTMTPRVPVTGNSNSIVTKNYRDTTNVQTVPWGSLTRNSDSVLTKSSFDSTADLRNDNVAEKALSEYERRYRARAIGKMIGNYIFDLINLRKLNINGMQNKSDGRLITTTTSYEQKTQFGTDQLFGLPCPNVESKESRDRLKHFQARLRHLDIVESLDQNVIETLFQYIERECLSKNMILIQSQKYYSQTCNYRINVKQDHSNALIHGTLLELELLQIGTGQCKSSSDKKHTTQILESHFNLLKESYILHQSSLLKLVKFDFKEEDGEDDLRNNNGKKQNKKEAIETIKLDEKNENIFLGYVFSLLTRYEKLFSSNAGSQSAIPPPVFSVLKKYLNVDGECYASPLNHQLPLYFSAFKDTDEAFGSLGPFCDNNSIEEGSWECNPPFDVNSIFSALKTIHSILNRAEQLGKPVTFSVFFADVSSNQGVINLINSMSKHKKADSLIKDHCYMYGFRHRPMDTGNYRNTRKNTERMNLFWQPLRHTRFLLFQSSKAFEELCHNDTNYVETIVKEITKAFAHNINVARNEGK
eukprot:g9501.t1